MIRSTTCAIALCLAGAASAHAQTVTLNTPATAAGTTIRGGIYAATNFDGTPLVTRESSDPTYVRHAILDFDTASTIPAGATIRSASLRMTVHAGGTDPTRLIGVAPVLRSFTASQATWDIAKFNAPWTHPGGDFGPVAVQENVPNAAGARVTFNVTALVQAATNAGSRHTRLALVDVDSLTNARAGYRDYYPVSAANPAVRPELTVTFGTGGVPTAATLPTFSHVFVVILENHEYGQIIGSASAPYINSLAKKYGLATNYTGVTHPSLPNYMALAGGKTVFTSDCQGCTTTAVNVADQVEHSGRTWKAYMESMPAPCGITDSGSYVQKHNPFVHYTDIVNNAARCDSHVVPMTSLATDLSTGRVANFVWITPNECSDMHNCSVATGDKWLSALVPKITSSPAFANSVLFVVWDEGTTTIGGGGHVPLIAVSPMTPAGTRSAAAYNHYSLLATIEQAWSLPRLGKAVGAAVMSDLFR